MTRGPIDPPITGSSVDFPVSLSVSVAVPVIMLLPSIDPPLSLSLLAVAGFSAKIGLLRALGKRTHQAVDPAASAIRPRLSSRPRAFITTKIPGEARDPVRAARNG